MIEKQRQKQGRIKKDWVIRLITRLIPAAIKGDISRELWTSIRDPPKFLRMATSAFSLENSKLKAHFLKKAEHALDKLSKLLWEPIVRNCRAVRRALKSNSRCDSPVSLCCEKPSMCSRSRSYLFLFSFLKKDYRIVAIKPPRVLSLIADADLLFTRPLAVGNSFCCAEIPWAFSDRSSPCRSSIVAAYSQLRAKLVGCHL